MWKASAGHQINSNGGSNVEDDDDWETDPDFVNDVSEQEQRWGSKTIEGSGRTAGAINMQQLREETEKADANKKKKEIEELNPGYGYGGKFGVQTDRMDKSAVGHDYVGKVEKHASQKDYSDGFGGKFGVQTDRVDKSAVSWDYKEKLEKHSSQKDYATGFGGKFGVQSDRVDKSAMGWDYVEKVEKHESQTDYAKGFGGKFGVQEDRKDKSAVGWDYVEAPKKHESQVDHKVGFGGKFGVQSDRMDKSAVGFGDGKERIGTNYTKVKPDIGSAKPSNLRAKFENLAQFSEEETRNRAAEQRRLREEKDKKDREEAAKRQIVGSDEPEMKPTQRKTAIDTGRQGGIGNAITAFNQIQSPTSEQAPQRREPIKLPKEPTPAQPTTVPPATVQPDVIPVKEPTPEPEIHEAVETPEPQVHITEPVVAPVIPDVQVTSEAHVVEPPAQFSQEPQQQVETPAQPADVENLADYIEDTGVRAIALYDYQAAADDEISFDPDDLITHIEMIDEGWWRGLCKNRYGLFPANYVQLQEQPTA